MATTLLDRRLSSLEAARYSFRRSASTQVLKLLGALDTARFADSSSLIRFHEVLLFLRAFPHGPSVVRKTEVLLNQFSQRVAELRERGVDLSSWDTFESAGVAGTAMEDTLSFDVARWLIRHMPGKVEIAWDNFDPGREAVAIWPRFLPLLQDDAYVEADTPWRGWLEAAQVKKTKGLEWLIRKVEALSHSDHDRAQLYDALRIPLRWDLGNSRVSRTRNWKRESKVFYQTEPLISRNQVSLARELTKKPPRWTRLSRSQGERVLDKIREIMLVRYRELYGTTLGDPGSVVLADFGRGLKIYLWNLPPDRRLPLRAYVAGFTLKNGVPINYIEAIGLCEWMEVGFNTFYTFRGGETAWVYAQVLRCLCHLMGTTCISVYPYQLGHDNEEAIESGAFWFYRKLGFRPGRPDLIRLVEGEERKIATNPKYRTPPRILRRLAASHVFYELPGSKVGAWDRFSTRNVGLRVNAYMAADFQGDSRRMRIHCGRELAQALGLNATKWSDLERASLENFAVALKLVRGIAAWTPDEKRVLAQIIRAKSARNETKYLHLTQTHARLRKAILDIGSASA